MAAGAQAGQSSSGPAPSIQMEAPSGLRIRKSVTTFKELKQRRVISQRYDFSCGAAALATILQHYYNLPVTEESIVAYIIHIRGPEKAARRYKEKKGFSLLDLKQAAASAGFRCLGYRDLELTDLVAFNAPVIVPIRTREYDHFVVFRGLRADRVYLSDPVAGNITMKASNFVAAWRDGVGMVLQSKRGLQPAAWQPDKSTQGFYVSQDQVRALAQQSGLGFVPKGPREF